MTNWSWAHLIETNCDEWKTNWRATMCVCARVYFCARNSSNNINGSAPMLMVWPYHWQHQWNISGDNNDLLLIKSQEKRKQNSRQDLVIKLQFMRNLNKHVREDAVKRFQTSQLTSHNPQCSALHTFTTTLLRFTSSISIQDAIQLRYLWFNWLVTWAVRVVSECFDEGALSVRAQFVSSDDRIQPTTRMTRCAFENHHMILSKYAASLDREN